MNDKIIQFLTTVLDSDITKEAKTEIVKFYTLPRNTPVRPQVELPDEEQVESLGSTNRPSDHDLKRKADPEMAAEEDEIKKTLKGVVDNERTGS